MTKNKTFRVVSVATVASTVLFLTGLGLFFNSETGWAGEVNNINIGVHAVVSGVKYEDLNQNGVKDEGEPLLNDWEICQETQPSFEIDRVESIIDNNYVPTVDCVLTGAGEWPDGYYEFLHYDPALAKLTETLQDGWTQSAPTAGSYEVEVEKPTTYSDNDFGNYRLPYCGDEEVNQESEECDEGADNTDTACVAGTDQTCTYCSTSCKVITVVGPKSEPKLISVSLTKSDTPDPVAAGADITYTFTYNITNQAVTDLTLTDPLPANTIFISASNSGTYNETTKIVTWSLGTSVSGSVTLTLRVVGNLANGTLITNVATLDSSEIDPASATAKTTVTSGPLLKITKVVETSPVTAGDTVNYIVTIKNEGSDTAKNVRMADTLPAGFTYVDGSEGAWLLGDMAVGDEKIQIYAVKVGDSVVAGTYTNTAQVSADNFSPTTATANLVVNPKPGVVLGEAVVAEEPKPEGKVLAATGTSYTDYLIALMLISTIGLTAYTLRKNYQKVK